MLAALHRRFGWPTNRYILFVGGADPQKNHLTLLQAMRYKPADQPSHRPHHNLIPPTHRFGDIPPDLSSNWDWRSGGVRGTFIDLRIGGALYVT